MIGEYAQALIEPGIIDRRRSSFEVTLVTLMRHKTGEGKVDYDFQYFWSSLLAPWEKNVFPPRGTTGIIRFYNFDIDSFDLKYGHRTGYNWLGKMALEQSVNQNNDDIYVIGAHSNTGDKTYNFHLAEARARAVARMLSEYGIPYERMDIMGSHTLDRDERGESERWRAVSVMFTVLLNPVE